MQKLKEKHKIPDGWQATQLGDVSTVTNGSTNTQDAVEGGEFPLFDRSVAIKRSDKYLFDDKAIILPGEGAEFVPKYFEGKFDLHQRAYAIFPNKEIDAKYLFHYLYANRKEFVKKSVGSTVRSLRLPLVQSVFVNTPPIKEQQKIAEILGVVDEDIAKTKKVIDVTEKLKCGLMQQLFTRGIGHTKFKQTKLGEIPEEWEILKGEDISTIITKGASPKWQGFDYQDEGMVFVTSENVRDGYMDLSNPKFLPIEFHKKLKNSQLQQGDILINIVGASIARSCQYISQYEYANINQAVCLFRVKDCISKDYILQYFQNPNVITRLLDSQGGSARPNLSLTDLRNFLFVLPGKKEQQKISEILSAVDEKISVNIKLLAKLTKLKKGLMQDLLSGDKRVKI
jgi:type I restriction enzyme S subunit